MVIHRESLGAIWSNEEQYRNIRSHKELKGLKGAIKSQIE